MKITTSLFAAMALFTLNVSGESLRNRYADEEVVNFYDGNRALTNFRGGGGRGRNRKRTFRLTVVNESFNQPFGGFLVMAHNADITPLYVRGQPSSDQLATLAEDGNPGPLVAQYLNDPNVLSVETFATGAPYPGGATFQVDVEVSRRYPLVTIASMAINTNDCFVALNGVRLHRGMVLDVPGLDAGTEENNELCASIPGPGCSAFPEGNVRSGNGEGFVHVHRGFFGIGDLPADRYDWRNPMMRVVVN